MQRLAYKQKTKWVVLPQELVARRPRGIKKATLRALRTAVSKAWLGASQEVVEEIRSQRKR